jgi:hypothetical protein
MNVKINNNKYDLDMNVVFPLNNLDNSRSKNMENNTEDLVLAP